MKSDGRILAIGAAGFIGSNLVDRLLRDRLDVIGLDSFSGNYAKEVKAQNLPSATGHHNFQLIEADLLTLETNALPELISDARPGVRSGYERDSVGAHKMILSEL